MKHHRLITRKPNTAQIVAGTTLEAKIEFKVLMVDRLITFVFQNWGNGAVL